MKVLLLYKDYHPVLGGIENHVHLLAQGLRAAGVDARVLVTNTEPHTVRQTIDGVPVIKTGRQAHILSTPISFRYFKELPRAAAEVELVHLHAPYPPAELAQLLLGRKKPFVITYHSDIVRQKLSGKLYAPLLRLVLQRAILVAVSSPAYVESSPFLQRIRHKCRLVHFGIDLGRFAKTGQIQSSADRLRKRFGDRPLLLFIGRLRHYKGVDVLIRAMRSVNDAHLLIVGDGPMRRDLQKLAGAQQLADRITFLGECTEPESLAARYAAQLFLLPSTNRAEALGIVQLEALACNLPVICTELGTGTSYVNRHEETGLVVPPKDPAALSAAINRLLADSNLRRQMGAAGRKRVQDEFALPMMIRKTVSFYKEALSALPQP